MFAVQTIFTFQRLDGRVILERSEDIRSGANAAILRMIMTNAKRYIPIASPIPDMQRTNTDQPEHSRPVTPNKKRISDFQGTNAYSCDG